MRWESRTTSFWEGAPATHTDKCPPGRLQVTGHHPVGAGSLRAASRKGSLKQTLPHIRKKGSCVDLKEAEHCHHNSAKVPSRHHPTVEAKEKKEHCKPALLLGVSSFPLVLLVLLYTYPSAHQAVVERQSDEAESCLLDEVRIQDSYLMRFSWDTGCHWLPKAIRGTLVTKTGKKKRNDKPTNMTIYKR